MFTNDATVKVKLPCSAPRSHANGHPEGQPGNAVPIVVDPAQHEKHSGDGDPNSDQQLLSVWSQKNRTQTVPGCHHADPRNDRIQNQHSEIRVHRIKAGGVQQHPQPGEFSEPRRIDPVKQVVARDHGQSDARYPANRKAHEDRQRNHRPSQSPKY